MRFSNKQVRNYPTMCYEKNAIQIVGNNNNLIKIRDGLHIFK